MALGTPLELTGAKSIKKLPEGKDSTKGKGQTEPDPDGDRVIASCLEQANATAAGASAVPAAPQIPVRAPCGGPTSTDVRRTSLLVRAYQSILSCIYHGTQFSTSALPTLAQHFI